jgi:hypothetical protein
MPFKPGPDQCNKRFVSFFMLMEFIKDNQGSISARLTGTKKKFDLG